MDPPLREGAARLNASTAGEVAIVIDASESAKDHWEAILGLAQSVLDDVPVGMRRLFFLGNHQSYDSNVLPENIAVWWQQNHARCSLLTPILDHVERGKVVVIGSGPIYDLEDWSGTDLDSRLILARVGGASLRGEAKVGVELAAPTSVQLLAQFHVSIDSVEISGEGFMPYQWDNPAYKVRLEAPVKLEASGVQDYSISLAFFGNDVKAVVRNASGTKEASLSPAETVGNEDWKPLTADECAIFRTSVRGEKFDCPICRLQHAPQVLRCKSKGEIIGHAVYKSLEELDGFVVFKEADGGVMYSLHKNDVIRLGPVAVAVRKRRAVTVYQYDLSTKRWLPGYEFQPYYCRENGTYLALV